MMKSCSWIMTRRHARRVERPQDGSRMVGTPNAPRRSIEDRRRSSAERFEIANRVSVGAPKADGDQRGGPIFRVRMRLTRLKPSAFSDETPATALLQRYPRKSL
jgi:hypothetical protein